MEESAVTFSLAIWRLYMSL